MKSISFGLSLNNRGAVYLSDNSINDILMMARESEKLSFDSVWEGDGLIDSPRYQPLTLLGAVAALSFAIKKEKGAARSVMGVAGILTVIVFAYMSYLFFAYPTVWGGNNLAYGFALGGLIFIVVAYLMSKAVHNRKGIDISLAFKEIPPE